MRQTRRPRQRRGIHVSAVKRNPLTYEHIEPEKVGNIRRILISDQAGKSNVLHKAKKFGIDLDNTDIDEDELNKENAIDLIGYTDIEMESMIDALIS